MENKKKILVVGTGNFAQTTLERSLNKDHDVIIIDTLDEETINKTLENLEEPERGIVMKITNPFVPEIIEYNDRPIAIHTELKDIKKVYKRDKLNISEFTGIKMQDINNEYKKVNKRESSLSASKRRAIIEYVENGINSF